MLRAPCLHTLSPHFVGYASSSHLVPTLCRTRQVKLTRRHEAAKSFNRRCPASQAHVRRFAQNIFVGRAVPVTPLRGVTGEPHIGHCNANPAHSATYPPLRELHQSGADIPVCARTRGQTGMSAPHYHTPALRLAGTASPHLRLRAFARASPALDEFKRGFGVGASRLHLVSHTLTPTPCHHTLSLYASSPHFAPTLCQELFQSPDTEVRPNENALGGAYDQDSIRPILSNHSIPSVSSLAGATVLSTTFCSITRPFSILMKRSFSNRDA